MRLHAHRHRRVARHWRLLVHAARNARFSRTTARCPTDVRAIARSTRISRRAADRIGKNARSSCVFRSRQRCERSTSPANARRAELTGSRGWAIARRPNFEKSSQDQNHTSHQRVEHDLPTVGVCVACATPPVDKPAAQHLGSPRGENVNLSAETGQVQTASSLIQLEGNRMNFARFREREVQRSRKRAESEQSRACQ